MELTGYATAILGRLFDLTYLGLTIVILEEATVVLNVCLSISKLIHLVTPVTWTLDHNAIVESLHAWMQPLQLIELIMK